jgi:hypothetical protein
MGSRTANRSINEYIIFTSVTSLSFFQHFLYGPMGLVDDRIDVGKSGYIGVGDGDSTERFSPDDAGLLIFRPYGSQSELYSQA